MSVRLHCHFKNVWWSFSDIMAGSVSVLLNLKFAVTSLTFPVIGQEVVREITGSNFYLETLRTEAINHL